MRFSKFSRQIFVKRKRFSPPSPLGQEIKEFLQAYEARAKSSQDALKESLNLYKNEITVCAFLYKPE